ncbi:MAG: hypothetical protein WA197_19145 [Candidatus Acidiferrales bacterium]
MADWLKAQEKPPRKNKLGRTGTKLIAPKKGDHVRSSQQEGVFEVVFINALMQTANVRLTDGSGHVVPNVAWTALKALNS